MNVGYRTRVKHQHQDLPNTSQIQKGARKYCLGYTNIWGELTSYIH